MITQNTRQLTFTCTNCGKFKSTQWEPYANGHARIDCPKCNKNILAKIVFNGQSKANVPPKAVSSASKPSLITNSGEQSARTQTKGLQNRPKKPFQWEQDQLKGSEGINVVEEDDEEFDPKPKPILGDRRKPEEELNINQRQMRRHGGTDYEGAVFDLFLKGVTAREISNIEGMPGKDKVTRTIRRCSTKVFGCPLPKNEKITKYETLVRIMEAGFDVKLKRKGTKEKLLVNKTENIPKPQRAMEMSGVRTDIDIDERLPSQIKMDELMEEED